MDGTKTQKSGLKQIGAVRRQAVGATPEKQVTLSPLGADMSLPLVVRPAVDGLALAEWARGARAFVEEQLLRHGGILFRGFNVASAEGLESFTRALCGDLLEYHDRATPRSQVNGNVYTSTDYAANQSIELHTESSYAYTWPLKLFFCSALPAEQGGETPIADMRRVYQRIDPAIRQRFAERGVMYIRNFGEGLGIPWQTAFNTDDRVEMERYCASVGIQVEWKDGDRLRTRQVRPAIARHPKTGEMVWFNQITAFHVTTLDPAAREALLAEYDEQDLPKTTCYGDGSSIEPEVLEQIRAAYDAETIAFPWERGDLLLLDNMLVAHGRAPYVGPRKVLVGMAEPCSWDQVQVGE